MLMLAALPPDNGRASAGARISALADEYWEGCLRDNPVTATALGDRRFDHLLEDETPEARELVMLRLGRLRNELRAPEIAPDRLPAADRLNHSALVAVIENDLALLACDLCAWVVDPLGGPPVSLLNIPAAQTVRSAAEAAAMVERWRAMGRYLDVHIDNLERGLATGRVAVATQVQRVIAQLDELLATPVADWALAKPAASALDELTPAEKDAFAAALTAAIAGVVRPACARYRDFLAGPLLARARPNDRPGLLHLPGGAECYRRLVRVHTSLDLDPETIHRIGREEGARLRDAMSAVGARVLGTSDFDAVVAQLRSDRRFYFVTRDEVEATARAALARAEAALPAWFGRLPRTRCEVRRMERHEEEHSTIAYYRPPAADGTRPGRYYINTSAPETRPRYGAESLAFHESIPGHHLQIAIAQEITALPEFRKHLGVTAYVEGWALYAEDLAGEMGLYSGDLELLGKLSGEAWRAARLVVDTGIHALGWSRDQAIAYLRAHTGEADNNIANEVDRYITWPGQALAYKLGQLEIAKLRAEATAQLGERFDIRAFHDCVLGQGAVGLGTLREIVAAWIASRAT